MRRVPLASVLGVQIDPISWEEILSTVLTWARRRDSRYVVLCNAHVAVTATRDTEFMSILNDADVVAPDGAPIAWMMRRLGFSQQVRISGPDLMWRICELCAGQGVSIYLYGSNNETLQLLHRRLKRAFGRLSIAGSESPPFTALSPEEDGAAVASMNRSGAGIVFVGLGCPKQERWMATHRGKVNAVMLGVGAAFDFHAETIARAPLWMQQRGVEWLHRLCSEPGRLWRRYLVTNTLFVIRAARQLLRLWVGGSAR